MRLFVTDAGGWPDRTAQGSREWTHGYREHSAGSGGERICNDDCTWACFTCVLRLALDAMYRACSVAMMPGPGHVAFLRDPPWPLLSARLLSAVPRGFHWIPTMRPFLTDAGAWLDSVAHGSPV
jgi:hypothetical protein